MGELSTDELRRKTISGTAWVAGISAIAIPLSQYRNWIFSQIDGTGGLAGYYAILLILGETIAAFAVYGAHTVTGYFLPRLGDRPEKSRFVTAYVLISCVLFLALYLINLGIPGVSRLFMKGGGIRLGESQLLMIALSVFLSQVAITILPGLLAFRAAAVLSQLQTVLICVVLTALFVIEVDLAAFDLRQLLTVFYAATCLVGAAIGAVVCFREVGFPRLPMLPATFWRYSIPIHLNSIASFVFNSVDQLFILAVANVAELGVYFTSAQAALLVAFIGRRVISVLIATFSSLFHAKKWDVLERGYNKVSSILTHTSFYLATFLIGGAFPLLRIFGEMYAARCGYLILLTWLALVSCLTPTNATLIQATGRTVASSVVNAITIGVQLATTIILLNWEVLPDILAVLSGRIAATAVSQIGYWWLVLRIPEGRFRIKTEYYFAVGLAGGVATCAYSFGSHWYYSAGFTLIAWAVYLAVTRWSPMELVKFTRR